MTDPATDFARATSLLREGNLAAAEALCRSLLTKLPRNAAATHLLGLIRKDMGDEVAGEHLMRESIALEPRQAEFRTNLANLLRRSGRTKEAEGSYREALGLDPRNRPARLGLARVLNDQGMHIAAEAEARTLIASDSRDAQAWSALAMTLRDRMKFPEAEAAYRQAIAIAPGSVEAHHNLGSLLSRLDRAEEAMAALDRAEALGLKGFELAFNRGMALLQLYRVDDAERAFAAAVAEQPLHAEAQINLARVRFMCGDRNFTRDISAAVDAHQGDLNLQVIFGLILRRAGDLQGAESHLRSLLQRHGPVPDARHALAEVLLESGRLKEAEEEALAVAGDQPRDGRIIDTLVTILLSRGRASDAMPFIRAQRALNPHGQGWIAYQATAARLLGDPLYETLYDYDRLVRTYDLESPPGWRSMSELNAAVLEALNARHRFTNHPLDQSLRNGSQTARNLLTDPDSAIQAMLRAFALPIEDYQRVIGTDPDHPLSARNRGAALITGAWSVQLRREGFHVNHVHPQGWISSAYYVSVPDEVRDESLMSGWIKFGETRYPVPGAGPEGVVQPRAGRLVLFPSYMWHGTNPIHGSEPRTTIAFDAVPPEQK